ncbi:MAG: Asp-tRNA(Asn)/Glu-tRNA(Gln) amidotransferase subunit GatA [Endomicrobiaceae bacterium]|nr:Asp-tRNA(Asn)/Glu-tRNA(Gln) amidotransferase subunit GatA [Endomicrobiaceae bacterium]
MNEIIKMTATELAEKIRTKQLKSVEITQAFINRAKEVDPKIKAYMNINEEYALVQAKISDQKISEGKDLGALEGVPVAIKDNILIKDLKMTASSKILENYIAPYDATVIEKLKTAGAVFVGKTNLDEFAMGSSTENSAFFTTRNPWNLEHIPGGSSGGSASAVSAMTAPLALGTDTGGSIRQPASCCGIVGVKPTYGRVSRFGAVAFASSLDQIGPMSKTVEDSALLLNVLAGYDKKDSTSINKPVPNYLVNINKDLKGIKIGLPKEYFIDGLDSDVKKAIDNAIEVYKNLGCEMIEISLPHTDYAVAVYYIICCSEASANLARYDGVRYGFRAECDNLLDEYRKSRGQGFGAEVKRRIMLGTYALSAGYYDAYYGKAQKVRTLIKQDFEKAYEKVDIILTPSAPTPAFKIGEKSSDPLQMYLSDIFTISCNLAGVGGISVPCGFSKGGIPIGLQLLSKYFDEETMFNVAYKYQQATDYHKQFPRI